MRSILRITVAAVAVVTLPTLAAAQGAAGTTPGQAAKPAAPAGQPAADTPSSSSPVQGALSLGLRVNDTTGDLTRVAPYEALPEGAVPQGGVQLWGRKNGTAFDLSAFNGGSTRDQDYRAGIDVRRYLQASVSFKRFNHRTDHDPLTYLDSAVSTFVVRHDDLDPTAKYSNAHGLLDARVDFTVPKLTPLKLSVSHRQDLRDGAHQSMTTSHCANCHTTAMTRPLSERTRDTIAGATLQLSRLTLEGEVATRTFKDDSATPTILYDKAVQPQTLADAFLNRVSYDSRSGLLPFDLVPRTKKNTQSVKARADLPSDVVLTGSYTHSKSTNTDGNFSADYSGAIGQVVVPVGARATLRASARHYSLAADDVFVDVGEPVAPAGPSAGLTYAQAYPSLGPVDFVRVSTLSRTPTEASVELDYRAAKRTTFRGQYEFEQVDRSFEESEKTTSHRLLVSGRSQPRKGLTFRFRADQTWTADPFTNRDAAIPTAYQLTPSPGLQPFGGQQYFEMYRSRMTDLTSFPTSAFVTDEAVTWSPAPRVAISGHYRMRRASNDDVNPYGGWRQSLDMPGAEFWVAAADRVTLTAGYGYQRERTETLFTNLAFVG